MVERTTLTQHNDFTPKRPPPPSSPPPSQSSVLAWEAFTTQCDSLDVSVISVGIRGRAAAGLPLISTSSLEKSSDEEDDKWRRYIWNA